MASITPIASLSQFNNITASSTYVIVDFYADWCGPCKQIAPIFQQLASTHASPGRIVFVKVDVDSQQEVARKFSISAMPTFLILKNGSVSSTIQGANPSALRSAVEAAASDAAKGSAKASVAFTSKGHTLGGEGTPSTATARSWTDALPEFNAGSLMNPNSSNAIVRFVGLYLTTLFSLDAEAAAAGSPFKVPNRAR